MRFLADCLLDTRNGRLMMCLNAQNGWLFFGCISDARFLFVKIGSNFSTILLIILWRNKASLFFYLISFELSHFFLQHTTSVEQQQQQQQQQHNNNNTTTTTQQQQKNYYILLLLFSIFLYPFTKREPLKNYILVEISHKSPGSLSIVNENNDATGL